MPAPEISIITATYNASHVLRYAIRSVLQSEFQDWELIVVGDACTDDTEQVVAGFNDARIHFVNLTENSGQQATPNNHGLTLARGRFIAFLNHDDMYLPFHLGAMRERALRNPQAIQITRYADVRVDDEAAVNREVQPITHPLAALRMQSGGPTPEAPEYDPRRWQIASSWFMPAEIAKRVGPWRLENQTYVTPSQDWLFRAWRQGVPVLSCTDVSVLVVCTGGRRNFFNERQDAVHEHLFARYVASNEAYDELCNALVAPPRFANDLPRWRKALSWLFQTLVAPVLIRMDVHPSAPRMLLRFGGRGGFIREWRGRINLD